MFRLLLTAIVLVWSIQGVSSSEIEEIRHIVMELGNIGFMTNERINCYVDGSVFGLVVEGGKIVEVAEGKLDHPTTNVFVDTETLDKIVRSDDPVESFKKAVALGKVRIEGVGLGWFKYATLSIAMKVLNAFESFLRWKETENELGQRIVDAEGAKLVMDGIGVVGYTTKEAQKLIENNAEILSPNAGVLSFDFPVDAARKFVSYAYEGSRSAILIFQHDGYLLFAENQLDPSCAVVKGKSISKVDCTSWPVSDGDFGIVDSLVIENVSFVRFMSSFPDAAPCAVLLQTGVCFDWKHDDPLLWGETEREDEMLKKMWEEDRERWEREAKVIPRLAVSKEVVEEMKKEGWKKAESGYYAEAAYRYKQKIQEMLGECEECEWVTSKDCRIIGTPKVLKVELLPYGTDSLERYKISKKTGKLINELSEDLDLLIFLSGVGSAFSRGKVLKIGTIQPGECKKAIMEMADRYFGKFRTSVWIEIEAVVWAHFIRYHCEDQGEAVWKKKISWFAKSKVRYLCSLGDLVGGSSESRLKAASERTRDFVKLVRNGLYRELNIADNATLCKRSEFPSSLKIRMGQEEHICWRMGG